MGTNSQGKTSMARYSLLNFIIISSILIALSNSSFCGDSDFKNNGGNKLTNSCNLITNATQSGFYQCRKIGSYDKKVACKQTVRNACHTDVLQIQINYGCDCPEYLDMCDSSKLPAFGVFLIFAMSLI